MIGVFHSQRPASERRRASRRELLRIGGLSLLGLSSAELARLRAAAPDPTPRGGERRRNACIFVFLFGGPSHIDLWDLKPDAPAEIRGEFRPIDSVVPGMQFCEHLPNLARAADKLCLLRSMTHRMPVHGPACSEMYTGRPYFGPPVTDQARAEDWPSTAALAMRFLPRGAGLPSSIVLPWYSQFAGQDKRIAGQTGGRMGDSYDPFLVSGDPQRPDFNLPGIALPDEVSPERMAARRALRKRLEATPAPEAATLQAQYEAAFAMLGHGDARQAFDLARESDAVRDRYGRTRFGQSLLLARRLIEAGTSLVTVNYDDGTQADKVSPFWDTHHHNFASLKNRLCPLFDQAFPALLEDLAERGLLNTTLVAATGEFGRTPKIGQIVQNGMTQPTGRDHWPHAFTVLLAGGGVRGGNVYGATNRIGAYVCDRPRSPADLSATILAHLGVDPATPYWDEFQQVRRRAGEGRVIDDLA